MSTYTKGSSTDTWNFSGNMVVAGTLAYGAGVEIDNGSLTITNNITTTTGQFVEGVVVIPKEITVSFPINASTVDSHFWTAPAAYTVTKIEEIHTVAGDDSEAVALMVKKTTGTQAPSSGAALQNTSFFPKEAANTVQSPVVTSANANLAAGNRLSLVVVGTLTTFAGGVITVTLKRTT